MSQTERLAADCETVARELAALAELREAKQSATAAAELAAAGSPPLAAAAARLALAALAAAHDVAELAALTLNPGEAFDGETTAAHGLAVDAVDALAAELTAAIHPAYRAQLHAAGEAFDRELAELERANPNAHAATATHLGINPIA